MTITETAEVARMLAVCPRCKTPHAEDLDRRQVSEFFYLTSVSGGGHVPHRACKECGKGLYHWRQVNGRMNPSVKCSARCTSARRADCECSCAGRNHGSDHR